MSEPEQPAALLISVWSHEGTRVGRIRGFRAPGEQHAGSRTVAGDEAIIRVVRDWLTSLDRPPPLG